MAISLPKVNEVIEVPLRMDDALDMTDKEYDAYLEKLDSSLLKFHEGQQPTLFKLRKVLPYRLSQKVEDMKMDIEYGKQKGDDAKMKPRMSWIAEEVRCALVGVVNPPGLAEDQCIEFKQDGDGGASKEFIAQLKALGVIMDLYNARNSISKPNADKKKSTPSSN